MARVRQPLLKMLGLYPSGDIGPYTMWFCWKRGITWFLKSPPRQPPTYLQLHATKLWSCILDAWNHLPPPVKEAWKRLAHDNRLTITAVNLYVHIHATRNWEFYKALCRRARCDPADYFP